MLKEKYKLRKIKIGLVSIGMAALFAVVSGTAEAAEEQKTEVATVGTNSDKVQTPAMNETSEKTPAATEQAQAIPYIELNDIQPGDTKITGQTQPNQSIFVKIDNKDVVSLEDDFQEVLSDGNGKFTYDLKGRKIVYNQKIDVEATAPLNLDEEALDEEDNVEVATTEAPVEPAEQKTTEHMTDNTVTIPSHETTTEKATNESNEADLMDLSDLGEIDSVATSYVTPRYEKAYQIPKTQLSKQEGEHQLWIEPILEGSGVIKGHTSVKGRVALAINNRFINLGDNEAALERLTDEEWQRRYEGIWRYIDDQGFFEFELNRLVHQTHMLKQGDVVTLSFKSEDDTDTTAPVVFNVTTEPFEKVEQANTVYRLNDKPLINKLDSVNEEVQVNPLYGDLIETELRGKNRVVMEGTKVIEGRTKYANALVQIESSLGLSRTYPAVQVDSNGHFTFDLKQADFQLLNGESLTFKVIDPHTQTIIAQTENEVTPIDEKEADGETLSPEANMPTPPNNHQTDKVTEQPKEPKQPEMSKDKEAHQKTPEVPQNKPRIENEQPKVTPERTMPTGEAAQQKNEPTTSMKPQMTSTPATGTNGTTDMMFYGHRMPFLQLTPTEDATDKPPFSLRFNTDWVDTVVGIAAAVDEENEEAVKKEKTERPTQLPKTGTAITLPLTSIVMMMAGIALLVYRRRSQ